jgi:hypothetical protein
LPQSEETSRGAGAVGSPAHPRLRLPRTRRGKIHRKHEHHQKEAGKWR